MFAVEEGDLESIASLREFQKVSLWFGRFIDPGCRGYKLVSINGWSGIVGAGLERLILEGIVH